MGNKIEKRIIARSGNTSLFIMEMEEMRDEATKGRRSRNECG